LIDSKQIILATLMLVINFS